MAGSPRPPLRTFHRWRVAGAGGRRIFRYVRSVERREAGCGCAGRRRRYRCGGARGAGRFAEVAGADSACAGAISCMRWRGWCRNIRGCSRCSKRWTTASRSARAATSIFRWWRGISTTTPAGRNCSSRNFRITSRAAWSARLFRGIFRCSCWRGKLLRRWRREIPWC